MSKAQAADMITAALIDPDEKNVRVMVDLLASSVYRLRRAEPRGAGPRFLRKKTRKTRSRCYTFGNGDARTREIGSRDARSYERKEEGMATLFAILALLSIGTAVVLTMMIVNEVSKRGVKINFFLLRLYSPWYIHEYRRLTLKEAGKVGPLFGPCVGSYLLALGFAVAYLILK
jgi:hypothetical protein